MRIAGLSRLPKLIRIADMFAEMFFFTDYIKRMLNMAKPLFTVIFLCHLIGCMWYMLGSLGESVGDTSTKQNIPLHTCAKDACGFQDAGQFFQYLSSFHWAVQIMCAGSMDISPRNSTKALL